MNLLKSLSVFISFSIITILFEQDFRIEDGQSYVKLCW